MKKELAAAVQLASQEIADELPQSNSPREGDTNRQKKCRRKKSSCQRPGCKVDWPVDPRASHKKYCSSLCDNALRAAAARVERYYKTRDCLAKAAIFNLNRVSSKPNELEESWIIYALVHDDGLQQVEVAELLGRHKSWINRRLPLIERLTDEAREALRLGLSLLHGFPYKDGLAAMHRAIQYHAYGYQSLERISAHFGTPKANWELLSQREQETLQRLTESTRVEARKSQEYQKLLDHHSKAEQDGPHEQPPPEDPPVSGDPDK